MLFSWPSFYFADLTISGLRVMFAQVLYNCVDEESIYLERSFAALCQST